MTWLVCRHEGGVMEIDEQFESEEDACAYAERANKDGRARFVFEQTHGYVP